MHRRYPRLGGPGLVTALRTALVWAVIACLVVQMGVTAAAPALGTAADGGATAADASPALVAAYPNPVPRGDPGEFVVVALPDGADPGRYALTDGRTTASLANASAGETVAVADDERAASLTDRPVLLAPSLSLANDGGRVRLLRNDTVVDGRRYGTAPEGEVVRWNGSAETWRPLGATDRPVVRADGGAVRAFVLPDAGGLPTDELRDADRRVLLGGYTLTSEAVVDALVAAAGRGVSVRVLVEGDPVGGRTAAGADRLDRLADAGVAVRVLGGPHDRYAYHHAKYAVVDDRAVVLTENWKPSGTGGNSSRGWGVVTRQPRVVEGLAATFRADAGWRDARQWDEHRRGRTFERGERARGAYPTRHEPERVPVDRTELLVAPDNAESRLVETVDGADESVDVVGATLGDWDAPLSRALRRAASRGVEVRILLSDAWYAREENRDRVERYEEWAGERDAPLTASLAESGDRYEKVHAKGAVVDDRAVVLGSLNWNEQAASENREVVLVLHGEAVADYYGRVFDADWRGGGPAVPVGLLGAVVGCLVLAALVANRIEFE